MGRKPCRRPSPRSLPMSSTSKRCSLSPTKPHCYVSRCFRIVSSYGLAEGDLAEAVTTWAEYIKAETLSLDLVMAAAPPESYCETHTIEGMTITLGVQRHV